MSGDLNRKTMNDPEFVQGQIDTIIKMVANLVRLSNVDHRQLLGDIRQDAGSRSGEYIAGVELVLGKIEKDVPHLRSDGEPE